VKEEHNLDLKREKRNANMNNITMKGKNRVVPLQESNGYIKIWQMTTNNTTKQWG